MRKEVRKSDGMRICSIEGCGKKHYANGLCKSHYYQLPEINEKKRRYDKAYRERPENKERIKIAKQKYASKPEAKQKKGERMRKYRHENQEKIVEQRKKYYRENKERAKRYEKEYTKRPGVREHRKQYSLDYYRKNPKVRKARRESSKKYRQKLRIDVLSRYSPKLICQRCGYKDIRALSIDHINGGGTKHSNELGGSFGLYRFLIKNNFPKGYQVLCMNCQYLKRTENNEYSKRRVYAD